MQLVLPALRILRMLRVLCMLSILLLLCVLSAQCFLPAQRVHLYCIEMVRYSDPHCSLQCLGGQCRLEANVREVNVIALDESHLLYSLK